MLEHGGDITTMARRYGIPVAEWLDLSTGVNPFAYPVPSVGAAAWTRLPQEEDGLTEAASRYFKTSHLLPLAGSMAAITALPRMIPTCKVGVFTPMFSEHERAWRRAGHEVTLVGPGEIERAIDRIDWLVVANPNNPTGHRYGRDALLPWGERLANKGGGLLVDEAFIDPTPELSVAPDAADHGVLVLRSFGKFFGLPGARLGFAAGPDALLNELREEIGPWSVNGPVREVARRALSDHLWRRKAIERLGKASKRLNDLVYRHNLRVSGSTSFFVWIVGERATRLHHLMAERGILLRKFDDPKSLRIGLPGAEEEWERLERELALAIERLDEKTRAPGRATL